MKTAGAYVFTVRTNCSATTATVRIRTQDCGPLEGLPNIITPNQDGRNDYFQVRLKSPRPLALRLFDRWGREAYSTEDYRNDWPQQAPAAGLYYYLLTDAQYGSTYRGWLQVQP